jgi:hypothetical protein
MFVGSSSDATCALFNEMPGAHEVFGEMPGAHMMCTEEEGTTFMNDMIGGGDAGVGGADVEADEDEIEETIEVVDADTGKTLYKRKPRRPVGGTIIPSGNLWKTNALLSRGRR